MHSARPLVDELPIGMIPWDPLQENSLLKLVPDKDKTATFAMTS